MLGQEALVAAGIGRVAEEQNPAGRFAVPFVDVENTLR